MSAPRKYVVGDRVVRREGNQLGAEVGEVIAVESDPYPYRVMFGYSEWIMSGLNLALAPEVAPSRKAKADGDFATVEEHIAAWKAGGRRWAKVEGFNVDAVQAERDADHAEQARFDAVAAMLAGDPVQAARCGVPAAPTDADHDRWWDAAGEAFSHATIHVDPHCPPGTAVVFSQSGSLAAMSTAPDGAVKVAGPMEIFRDAAGELHVRMSDGSTVNLTDPVVGPASVDDSHDPIADRLVYLQRVQQRAQTDPEVHQTCDTQDAILDAVVTLLELAVRR